MRERERERERRIKDGRRWWRNLELAAAKLLRARKGGRRRKGGGWKTGNAAVDYAARAWGVWGKTTNLSERIRGCACACGECRAENRASCVSRIAGSSRIMGCRKGAADGAHLYFAFSFVCARRVWRWLKAMIYGKPCCNDRVMSNYRAESIQRDATWVGLLLH